MARSARGRPRRRVAPVMRKQVRSAVGKMSVDALIDAAALILEREGVDGLTTNRVAAAAGVSVGTLYQYFANKEALVAALFDRNTALYERALIDAIARARDGGAASFVEAAVTGYTELLETLPKVHKALHELRGAAGVNERAAKSLARNVELIAQMLIAGGASAPDARTIAFIVVHAAEGVGVAIAQLEDRDFVRSVTARFGQLALAAFASVSP